MRTICELYAAHTLIRNSLGVMTIEQKSAWGRANERDEVSGEGVSRDAESVIGSCDSLELLPYRVHRRKAFANASAAGRHLEEMPRRDPVACRTAGNGEQMPVTVAGFKPVPGSSC